MRICLVSSSFHPATYYGGPISATWGLSKMINSNDIAIYVSTTNANGYNRLSTITNEFIQKDKNFFVKYYHEQIINHFSVSFLFGIWGDIKKSDIVYVQYLFHYTVLFALFASVIQRKKVVLSPRGSLSTFTLSYKRSFLKSLWIKLFIKPFYKFFNWHASSYLEAEDIKKMLPNAKLEIINDGVDFLSFQKFKKYDKETLIYNYTNIKFKDISNVFFSLGRLHTIKGFNILIDAFSIFIEKSTASKLIIAGGDDGEEDKLRKQIIDLNLQDSVFLIGEIGFEDKKILLNNCDYFTLASNFESFGIVIAEALSCGKPVVISNKTPWKNLEINKCGILVDNEKNKFADALSDILSFSYDSKSIKNYIKSNYDWNIIIDRFLKSIKNIKCIF